MRDDYVPSSRFPVGMIRWMMEINPSRLPPPKETPSDCFMRIMAALAHQLCASECYRLMFHWTESRTHDREAVSKCMPLLLRHQNEWIEEGCFMSLFYLVERFEIHTGDASLTLPSLFRSS